MYRHIITLDHCRGGGGYSVPGKISIYQFWHDKICATS